MRIYTENNLRGILRGERVMTLGSSRLRHLQVLKDKPILFSTRIAVLDLINYGRMKYVSTEFEHSALKQLSPF